MLTRCKNVLSCFQNVLEIHRNERWWWVPESVSRHVKTANVASPIHVSNATRRRRLKQLHKLSLYSVLGVPTIRWMDYCPGKAADAGESLTPVDQTGAWLMTSRRRSNATITPLYALLSHRFATTHRYINVNAYWKQEAPLFLRKPIVLRSLTELKVVTFI